jgi:hypothetical protein
VDSKSSITTGLNKIEPKDNNFRFWPNPFTDVLNFKALDKIKQVSIFDLNGKKCFLSEINSKYGAIYPNRLKCGIYLLRILFADNSVYTLQVIKN